VLVWIYYSAQIFFFGAEFTQVYTNRYGSRVQPAADAQFVTEEARAQQGIEPDKEKARESGKGEAPRGRTGKRLASPWFR
jgi:membrane protein